MMEHVLCEPVELTESELDAVAGGNPFSNFELENFNTANFTFTVSSEPATLISNTVNNSVSIT
jgi:hypothetical protein